MAVSAVIRIRSMCSYVDWLVEGIGGFLRKSVSLHLGGENGGEHQVGFDWLVDREDGEVWGIF